ncbi:MAG: tRNA-dihydrouridine synthase [Deltaproteobacteria bacterium]|nr:tRNA-dihydrouridine synthase [Deltaproteobacteria bacterium]
MNFWRDMTKPIIGLSPMDGVTDASFRFITAKYGPPDVTVTEFVNVEAALYAPHTLIRDLAYSEIERPVIAQIYGHTPELFYKVAHVIGELGFNGLDINMGCPAKTVASKGSGAGLILKPELAQSIIRAARQGIEDWSAGQSLDDLGMKPALIQSVLELNRRRFDGVTLPPRRAIPVSVKTRLGYDDVVVEEWIRTLLEEKPAAITLHGRTLKQQYKGSADWDAIARAVEIAKNSDTLILGNGDLKDMEDVYRRVRETNVDGVLIGRAAQGEPWIFRAKEQVKQALRSQCREMIHDVPVSLAERFRIMLEHSAHFASHTQIHSFVGMRKHLAWYSKGSPGAAELRAQMVRVKDIDEVAALLRAYATSLGTTFAADRPPAWPEAHTLQP